MASDFSSYLRRAERLKALERVLEAAKTVFAAATQAPGKPDTWEALAALKRAVAEADSLPPLHKSSLEE